MGSFSKPVHQYMVVFALAQTSNILVAEDSLNIGLM